MAWFIIECERQTWTKYLVEANDEEAAMSEMDDWSYGGYVDGEDTETKVAAGPFDKAADALSATVAFVGG